jgi:hypothetical protein
MASFAGISFDVDGADYSESRESRTTIQDIPGGDVFYVDLAGRGQLKITLSILLDDAGAYGALNGQLGNQGSLAIDTLDGHQAVLTKVGRAVPYPSGQVVATAEFLVTDT